MSTRRRRNRRGTALVTAAAALSLMAVMTFALFVVSVDSTDQIDTQSEAYELRSGAESAINRAAHELWTTYLQGQGGEPGALGTFRAFLDARGIAAPAPEGGVAAASDQIELLGGNELSGEGVELSNVRLRSLRVEREDDADATHLAFIADVAGRRGEGGGAETFKSVQQVFTIEGGGWSGLDYALLANNVNCIMCHAAFDSTDRYFNSDPTARGQFERIKIGTLENLMLRSSADSTVAGTVYVRGKAMTKSGDPITDWSDQSLKGYAFDADGNVIEDEWGDMTLVDLVPAGDDAGAGENLYMDYGVDDSGMADGYMPTEFPPPIPDDGGDGASPDDAGNRTVDPSEFAARAAEADGEITGGIIFDAGAADAVDTATELSSAMASGNATGLDTASSGSVILTGTEANPIVIEGEVAIQGDLVIQGVVKGSGSLLVSGNVYVPTDLQYADGTVGAIDGTPRTFGKGNDGVENGLGIASGGNVILGNVFRGKGGSGTVTGYEDGPFSFVLSELAIFNRKEWAFTQPILPGDGDDYDDPSSWTQPNPDYRPDYVPRYYAFTDDGTIPIFNREETYFDAGTGTWKGKEHISGWGSELTYAYPADPTDRLLYEADGSPIAAVTSLTAGGGWITNEMLEQLMVTAEQARDEGPMQVDALLYSNNSIFGLIPKSSTMEGQLVLNGGIVAPDIGMLVAGNGGVGMQLNYDPRVEGFLRLAEGGVSMRRSAWIGAVRTHRPDSVHP